MHPQATPTQLPRWGPRRRLRCSSLKYSRYCHPTAQNTRGGGPGSRSSRLAGGAPRPSRCDARLSPRAAWRQSTPDYAVLSTTFFDAPVPRRSNVIQNDDDNRAPLGTLFFRAGRGRPVSLVRCVHATIRNDPRRDGPSETPRGGRTIRRGNAENAPIAALRSVDGESPAFDRKARFSRP